MTPRREGQTTPSFTAGGWRYGYVTALIQLSRFVLDEKWEFCVLSSLFFVQIWFGLGSLGPAVLKQLKRFDCIHCVGGMVLECALVLLRMHQSDLG